jgi:hypothetical protein
MTNIGPTAPSAARHRTSGYAKSTTAMTPSKTIYVNCTSACLLGT